MRAIVQHGYGRPDRVLELRDDVSEPVLEADRVLIHVVASSVNAGDWRRVTASPFIIRLVEGVRRPKTRPGADLAGTVTAVGAAITDLQPGDEVFGVRSGAYAEFASGKMVVRKPAGLTFEQAAAIPVAGLTALQALREHGAVRPGQHVAVIGAGGGVGTFAVQIAKALGAEVTAVSRGKNEESLKAIGADHVIDYERDDFTRGSQRYDLIVDLGGRHSIAAMRRVLNPGGKVILVGAGAGMTGTLGRLIGSQLRTRLLKQPIVNFLAKVNREDLQTLADFADAGTLVPVIERAYPLAQVAAALEHAERGHPSGKIVITVDAAAAARPAQSTDVATA